MNISISQRTDTMSAAIVTGPGTVRIETLPLPQPGRGQVRIRLEGCGVCASNLVPWAGPEWMQFPTEPGALGHEGWGIIDAVGEDVHGFAPGDRVAALSYHAMPRTISPIRARSRPCRRLLQVSPFPANRSAVPSTSSGAARSVRERPWRSSASVFSGFF